MAKFCNAGVRQKQRANFMISNERPSPFTRQPYRQPYHQPYAQSRPRPFVQEDTLKSEQIQIEHKSFLLALKENPRGRFLRISEEVGGNPPLNTQARNGIARNTNPMKI